MLTTYETLRDLEFSLSAVRWGTMVCDEAQRIKTPSAMVTKAAKKQNAAFRVACTGTPVENWLMDLWCLFDFVQPGLLGSPTAFGKTYSRPIEAKSDEQRAAVETLRKLIEPQVMRRMKEDVTDLPPKVMDDACSRLLQSPPLPLWPRHRGIPEEGRRGEGGWSDGCPVHAPYLEGSLRSPH